MKISKIKISNILGIEDLEITPQGFTEISGQNGQGKTSVLEAIKSVFEGGGHDATLLRKGADKGEIVVVIDEDIEITKRVNLTSSPVAIKKGEEKIKKTGEFLKGLTDILSVNPVDFLRAPKKDRMRVLLDTMPIAIDPAYLEMVSGIAVTNADPQNGLATIDFVRKQVFDDRAGTNRAIKEKESTINQLKQAMPDTPENMVDGSEDELREKLEGLNNAREKEINRIRDKLDAITSEKSQAILKINSEGQEKIQEIKAQAQAQIDAIREQVAKEILLINEATKTETDKIHCSLDDIKTKAAVQRERTQARHVKESEPIKASLAAISSNRSLVAKRQQAISTIMKMEEELVTLNLDANQQNDAITKIDEYKIKLLESLPIRGLEVLQGDIYRDGVQFDRLNTAQQVDIAVEIAKLRAGELKICCVDGIELLDSAAFEAFKQKAIESGLQLFVSKVSDAPFKVNTSN